MKSNSDIHETVDPEYEITAGLVHRLFKQSLYLSPALPICLVINRFITGGQDETASRAFDLIERMYEPAEQIAYNLANYI